MQAGLTSSNLNITKSNIELGEQTQQLQILAEQQNKLTTTFLKSSVTLEDNSRTSIAFP